ncbi:hypothetical protein [Methylovulum psychrotolerans]|nr:hypothetical protein [Methylovulum psychrotolerans]
MSLLALYFTLLFSVIFFVLRMLVKLVKFSWNKYQDHKAVKALGAYDE